MKLTCAPLLNLISLLFVFQFLTVDASSQTVEKEGKIVAFHPAAGNSITLAEKKEFGIFPEYNDSLFESAQLVKYDSARYTVLIKARTGQSLEREILQTELNAIYKKIESVKPVASIVKPSDDDYVVNDSPRSKEKEATKKWNKSAYIAGQVTLQVLFLFLEILVNLH